VDRRYREFSAKAAGDDRAHLVEILSDALLDPSPYRTRCGQPVFEVYNVTTSITCPACANPGQSADLQVT
jgi:hypothetical protein